MTSMNNFSLHVTVAVGVIIHVYKFTGYVKFIWGKKYQQQATSWLRFRSRCSSYLSQCRRALPVRHGQTVKHSSDTDIPAFLQYGVVSSRVARCDLAVSTKKTRQQGKTMLCVFLKESVEWTHSISITMAEQQCEMNYQHLCIPTVEDRRTVVQCLENCW